MEFLFLILGSSVDIFVVFCNVWFSVFLVDPTTGGTPIQQPNPERINASSPLGSQTMFLTFISLLVSSQFSRILDLTASRWQAHDASWHLSCHSWDMTSDLWRHIDCHDDFMSLVVTYLMVKMMILSVAQSLWNWFWTFKYFDRIIIISGIFSFRVISWMSLDAFFFLVKGDSK